MATTLCTCTASLRSSSRWAPACAFLSWLTFTADNKVPKGGTGRLLYFDKRLSQDDTIPGASCHSPEHAYTDGAPNSNLDERIKPLKLTDGQKMDLVAFLKSLNGEGWRKVTAPAAFP